MHVDPNQIDFVRKVPFTKVGWIVCAYSPVPAVAHGPVAVVAIPYRWSYGLIDVNNGIWPSGPHEFNGRGKVLQR